MQGRALLPEPSADPAKHSLPAVPQPPGLPLATPRREEDSQASQAEIDTKAHPHQRKRVPEAAGPVEGVFDRQSEQLRLIGTDCQVQQFKIYPDGRAFEDPRCLLQKMVPRELDDDVLTEASILDIALEDAIQDLL
jgi:hypothetical protein